VKIRVLKLGKIAYPEIRELGEMYIKRCAPLARPVQVDNFELKEDASIDGFLEKPAGEHLLIALDEGGKHWTSIEMAGKVQAFIDDPGIKSVSFLIGAPMGLTPGHRQLAKATLSFAKVTMTSDMAWLLLCEQLYRSFNILKGTGYHHA
jgi:23S rRNA (pseudouridine1915-N3)-methyltransferase